MTADLQLEIEDRWLTTPRGEDEVPSTTKRVKSLTIDGDRPSSSDADAPSSGPASAPPSDPAAPPRAAGSAFSEGPTLESLRAQLAAFARARDWDQFHTPRNVLLAMCGEVGELAELFQWRGDAGCPPGLAPWTEADKTHLGEEMADVLLYLVRLADRCGVDLPRAAEEKLLKNGRKYPADRCRGSAAKYHAYERTANDAAAAGENERSGDAKEPS
jgi:dCTP diphosphatase